MAYGRKSRKKVVERKMYAAKLLQQFSGTLRFGKRRFHLRASLTERLPKHKIFFLNFCRRLNVRKKKLHREPTKNYFPLPNRIYQLGLSAGAIAVYGYLLYIGNRETYQCHASYATIGNAVGMSRNTVRKYVQELNGVGSSSQSAQRSSLETGAHKTEVCSIRSYLYSWSSSNSIRSSSMLRTLHESSNALKNSWCRGTLCTNTHASLACVRT